MGREAGKPKEDKFYLGCTLNLCGCIFVNGGTNLMKKGTMVKSRVVWLLGVLCFVVGNAFNFVSFSMAPQSVLASLSAIQFVSNVFFAWCLLGELITRRIVFATVLIVVGVLVAVGNATHKDSIFSTKTLVEAYRIQYTSYLGVQAICLTVMQLLYCRAPKGASYAPVCFAGVSAIIGTQSAVQAKCVSELIKIRSSGGDTENAYPWFPFFVGGLLLFSQVFWLARMQKALGLFDGAVIIPMLQVFWTSLSILTGGLYFKEFIDLSWNQVGLFMSGLVILFIGVYFLVPAIEGESETPDTLSRRSDGANLFCGAGLVDIVDLVAGTIEDESGNYIVQRLHRLSRLPSRLVELSHNDSARAFARTPSDALKDIDEQGPTRASVKDMVICW